VDLKDQLKKLYPDHVEITPPVLLKDQKLWIQQDPLLCKYEKRKGKATTIIEGYTGATSDFKQLAKQIKQLLSVGGSFKNEQIIIQGDYRDQIMSFFTNKRF
jgi:translation initiation factor 1